MDTDGTHRKELVASNAREPFWAPDSKVIGYLPQEYPKFNVIDFSTKGMNFYDLDTGKIEEHPNSASLHHLYNPAFAERKMDSINFHAGMGVDHAIAYRETREPDVN